MKKAPSYYREPSRLKDARQLARIPQQDLAAKLRKRSSVLSSAESGRTPVKYEFAMEILEALESFGVDVTHLRTPPVKDPWATISK